MFWLFDHTLMGAQLIFLPFYNFMADHEFFDDCALTIVADLGFIPFVMPRLTGPFQTPMAFNLRVSIALPLFGLSMYECQPVLIHVKGLVLSISLIYYFSPLVRI